MSKLSTEFRDKDGSLELEIKFHYASCIMFDWQKLEKVSGRNRETESSNLL